MFYSILSKVCLACVGSSLLEILHFVGSFVCQVKFMSGLGSEKYFSISPKNSSPPAQRKYNLVFTGVGGVWWGPQPPFFLGSSCKGAYPIL